MLLKNGRAAIAVLLTAGGKSSAVAPVKRVDGTTVYAGYNSSAWPSNGGIINNLMTTVNGAGIIVGSGNTPVTADDYCLAQMITTGISGSISAIKTETENALSEVFAITVQNSGESAITIAEVGMAVMLRTANTKGSTASSSTPLLIDRVVLDSPVIVAPGDSEVINYTINVEL